MWDHMELAIDHFRLLGVSTSTACDMVLQVLRQRLEQPPGEGYSSETLKARAQLLRASADLLSDQTRRNSYEAELLAMGGEGASCVAALEIPSSLEAGGLILLLEASLAQEALDGALKALQPPQAPALGSGREADLTLLAATAARAAAGDLWHQRRYEQAAIVLQQAVSLLQKYPRQGERREQLQADLAQLLPYRVLDLLSRDLSVVDARQRGLELLDGLIAARGGLEGSAEGCPGAMTASAFQDFLKQIRSYMTVEEQIERFEDWARKGSPTADFLGAHALTSAGFSRHQPALIFQALERLTAMPTAGLEPELSCLQLLLGRTDLAQKTLDRCDSAQLAGWLVEPSGDRLADLCCCCRKWLSDQVLPGYRDVLVDADLDGYFADPAVQTFIQAEDRGQAPRQATVASHGQHLAAPVGSDTPPAGHAAAAAADAPDLDSAPVDLRAMAAATGLTVVVAVSLVAGRSWLLQRQPSSVATPAAGERPGADNPAGQSRPGQGLAKPAELDGTAALAATQIPPTDGVAGGQAAFAALQRADRLDERAAEQLVKAWLAAKAALLRGDGPLQPGLDAVATRELVAGVRRQVRDNRERQLILEVSTELRNVEIIDSSEESVTARINLSYRDRLLDRDGVEQQVTDLRDMTRDYVFTRPDGSWLLTDFYGV